jgi:hypothetical protein
MLRQEAAAPVVTPIAPARQRGIVPWLIALIALLAVAVLVLGAMLIGPMVTTTPHEAMIRANVAAWNAHDADAVRANYTDDAILWTSDSATPTARGADEIASTAQYGGLTVEIVGPMREQGNLVWMLNHVSSGYDVAGDDEVTVFYLRDGKIAQQWVVWNTLE